MAAETALIPNEKFISAINPFLYIFRLYGIDMTVGLSLNSRSKFRSCCNNFQGGLIICVVVLLTLLFIVNVDFLELDPADKCMSISSVICATAMLLFMCIFHFKRTQLNHLVNNIGKYSYLIEKFQPHSFRRFKMMSYSIILAPYIFMISLNIYTPIYVKLCDPDNTWGKFFDSLMNKTLTKCYDVHFASNAISICDGVIPVVGYVLLSLWCIITFAGQIHCIGIIIILNVIISQIYQCAEKTYSEESVSNRVLSFELRKRNINKFIKLHNELNSIVKMADGAFREVHFIMSATELINVIMSFRCMNLTSKEENNIFLLLPTTLVFVVTFVSRTLFAGKVNYQVTCRTPYLCLVSASTDDTESHCTC